MARFLERSLLLRLGLAMAAITMLAFLGMLSSVFIAEASRGDAGAVNIAGSLRMQSYRIATALTYGLHVEPQRYRERVQPLATEFEQRLASPRLTVAIPLDADDERRRIYARIGEQWRQTMRPMLDLEGGAVPVTPLDLERRYVGAVAGFVDDIDRLVKLLEIAAEGKIENLRLIQVTILFLTVAIVFVTMHLMHTDVLLPLRDLLEFAERARRGDLEVRTHYTGDDELGRLGRAFNMMAEDLSKLYASLESRVRAKTQDLERTNRSLELLYNTTKRLNEAGIPEATYEALLADIEKLVGVGSGAICLGIDGSERAFKLATTWAEPGRDERPHPCNPPDCAKCFGQGGTQLLNYVGKSTTAGRTVISIAIADRETRYGVLLMDVPEGDGLAPWQIELLEAVARHIAIALRISERAAESRRVALLEERNVIARELHDSLAQSLSYLKIQASRINAALGKEGGEEKARAVVGELRDGLNGAYRQLRELLATFRLKVEGRNLGAALDQTVTEFRDKGELPITLHNRIGNALLSPNEEIHVLQIIREALSNVTRHARAGQAEVTLAELPDGRIQVTVADDGIGIPDQAHRRHHYGLAIMNERAHSLRGTIHQRRRDGGGTEVRVTFVPELRHARVQGEREL